MKRFFALLLLIATLTACLGAAAAFASEAEMQIENLAKQNEKVVDCRCVIYQRACIVALKTEKFTAKSEYDDFTDGLQEKIKTDYQVDTVIITRSPKVMHALAKLADMDEETRGKTIEKLIDRELNKYIEPHKVMPRR